MRLNGKALFCIISLFIWSSLAIANAQVVAMLDITNRVVELINNSMELYDRVNQQLLNNQKRTDEKFEALATNDGYRDYLYSKCLYALKKDKNLDENFTVRVSQPIWERPEGRYRIHFEFAEKSIIDLLKSRESKPAKREICFATPDSAGKVDTRF